MPNQYIAQSSAKRIELSAEELLLRQIQGINPVDNASPTPLKRTNLTLEHATRESMSVHYHMQQAYDINLRALNTQLSSAK